MASPSVLIVDDVPEIVEELTQMLMILDIPAVGAASIEAALAQLAAHESLRVVVTDVNLHHENGHQLVEQVNASASLSRRALRYLFITGDPDSMACETASPNRSMLIKPVNPRILISCIRTSLDG